MKLKTFDQNKNRDVVAGYLDAKNRFIKRVNDRHFHRKFKAYGIQEDIIGELCDMNVADIIIKNNKEEFHSNMDTWLKYAILKDFGHGLQRFLPITYMLNIKKEKK